MSRMDPYEIRAELLRRRVSFTDIGNECGFTGSFVSAVVHGRRNNLKVKQAVARHIRLPVEAVFGAENVRRAVS